MKNLKKLLLFVYVAAVTAALTPSIPASAAKAPPLGVWAVLMKNHKAEGTGDSGTGNSATRISYTLSAGGLTGTLTEITWDKRARVEILLGPLHEIEVDNGKESWQQDSTGNIRAISGDELSENRIAMSFTVESYDPKKDKNKGKVILRPEREPGTGAYIVDFMPKGGSVQTVYFDPKTFLRTKTIMRKGGIAGSVTIDAYKAFGNSKIPSKLEIGYAGMPIVVTAELASAKKLTGFDPLMFKKPDTNRDWTILGDEGAQEATVPFSDDDNEIVLPIEINGKKLRMILDSGAGSSFITAAAAERAGLKPRGNLPSLGYGGTAQAGIATKTTVEVPGAVRINNLSLYVVTEPAATASAFSKVDIDGAIGYDVFARFAVEIDYAKKQVTFLDPRGTRASEPDSEGTTVLPIRLDNRIPTIMAALDGQAGRFVVDTGDTGTVHLYTQFAKSHNLYTDPADPKARVSSGSGVGGKQQEVITDHHKLTMSKLTIPDLEVATSTSAGIMQVFEHAGGIGNIVWENYVVRFDYQRNKIVVMRVKDDKPKGTSEAHPPDRHGMAVQGDSHGTQLRLAFSLRKGDEQDLLSRLPETRRVSLASPPYEGGGSREVGPGITPCSLRLAVPLRKGDEQDKLTGLPETRRVSLAPPPYEGGGSREVRFASSPTPVPSAASLTLDQLLTRHVAALGGRAAIERLTSTRMEAKIDTGGITGTIVTVFAAPDKEYEKDKLAMLDVSQGYDGKVAWRRDANGNVRHLAGNELKALRDQIYLDTVAYALPGRIGGKLTLRASREPKSGSYIVDAEPDGGILMTLYFDPKTYLIVKEEHKDDNVLVTTIYSAYRAADGVQFPMHQHVSTGNARYDTDVQVTRIKNLETFPVSLFSPPNASGKYSFLNPGATSASVPFELDAGEISIPVRVNGKSENMFFDTGASGIAISSRVTDALKLKNAGHLEARGYGGSTDLTPVMLDTFEVGNAIRLKDAAAAALPLGQTLDPLLKKPVAGFVGYDLLAHFVVRIDYAKRILTFIDPNAFSPTKADGVKLSLNLENDIPAVIAQLDDLEPASFLLDTGDTSALRLYSPYVDHNKLAARYPNSTLSVGGGIAGVSKSRRTTIKSFKVAGVAIKNVPADFSLDPVAGASVISAGSVGSVFLSRFTLTFDYPHNRVFFAPLPTADAPFDAAPVTTPTRL